MQGMAGYLYSLEYAKERRQADTRSRGSVVQAGGLIEHADVRRMLLQQKCYCEGAFALAIHAGNLIDMQAQDADPQKRREATLKLELLTPVIKAWSGEWCTKANDLAIQVLGGYGYTARLSGRTELPRQPAQPIHEGSNGIQGIDLLGRKAMMGKRRGAEADAGEMHATAAEAELVTGLESHASTLRETADMIADTTRVLSACIADGRVRLGLANASL